MTTPQVKTRFNAAQRAAFTLVELMVVILIIGILTAIATPFIFGALTTSREFTIINEVQQMSAAVERFKTKHGFYPPSLNSGATNGVNSVGEFRRYLNRIAPNHAEGTGADGGGLQTWWTNVGSKLDARSSLVFWLSGLCTSKQYPLSGSAAFTTTPLAPYNTNKLLDDVTETTPIDRNVFYDFKFDQLVSVDPTAAATLGIKVYNQPYGKGDDLAFRYRDFKSYMVTSNNAYYNVDPTVAANFSQPNLISNCWPRIGWRDDGCRFASHQP